MEIRWGAFAAPCLALYSKKIDWWKMERRCFELVRILEIYLAACIIFFGMYYEFCGAVLTPVLFILIFIYWKKYRRIEVSFTVGSLFYVIFLIGHICSFFYGIDAGMIFLGLGKIVWIAPFLLLHQQLACEQKKKIYRAIPWLAAGIMVVGLTGIVISPLKELLWVNHRLGGTFQYPNTFAIFLLAGIIILIHEDYRSIKQILCLGILCVGIAASGSRIVMIMSVPVIGLIIIAQKKWKLGCIFLALVAVGACYIFATGDTATVGRIFRVSFSESTLIGRLLYTYDAFGLLLRHPFGMGYMGYYYAQSMIQTGVYTVRYVHNDLLQIGLDIGWFPMLAYVWAVCKCVRSRELSVDKKWILVTVFVHGLLDFDLSYTIMLCLMLVIMDDVRLTGRWLQCFVIKEKIFFTISAIVSGVCIYIAIPEIAEYCSGYKLAANLYPWHTEANLHLLSESDDINEVERLADRILKQNDTCALVCYGKAYAAYCRDDYWGVIQFQKECIARDYFNYKQYLNYAYMLCDGIWYADDEEVQEACRAELENIPKLLEQAEQKLSFLGTRIADQPKLEVDGQLEVLMEEGRQLF